MYLCNVYIRQNSGAYVINSSFDYRGTTYIFYSKKEALKKYKEKYGLKYKNGERLENYQ